MTAQIAYVANTNNLKLSGLKSELEGSYLNGAAVTVTVKDADGNPLTGETWPLTMNYVSNSNGDYVADLVAELNLVAGQHYTAFIDADGSTDSPAVERKGHWEIALTAKTRKS